MIIRIFLILSAVIFLFFGLASKQGNTTKAWRKILFFVLTVLAVAAVIFPELINDAAKIFGVGRGADLLLYFLTVTFVGYALTDYSNRQNSRKELYELARKVALLEAYSRYKIKKER
jgi:hypothetical protein